jgi:hypothetical protein
MQSVGGDITSCKLVASNPTVIAEMTFVERAGAEKVIDTFNGKKVSTGTANGNQFIAHIIPGGR